MRRARRPEDSPRSSHGEGGCGGPPRTLEERHPILGCVPKGDVALLYKPSMRGEAFLKDLDPRVPFHVIGAEKQGPAS